MSAHDALRHALTHLQASFQAKSQGKLAEPKGVRLASAIDPLTPAAPNAPQQQAAREKAARLWQLAHSVDAQHPYLVSKQLIPYGARQLRQMILLPISVQKQMVNLQLINPAGETRFLSAGQLEGASLVLGRIRPGCELLLCQDWASACSLHQVSGRCVIISFSAPNLVLLAERLASLLPSNSRVIICGDLAHGGAGQRAAARAALSLPNRSRTLFPPVEQYNQEQSPMRHVKPPDNFNDLHQQAGLDAVGAALQAASQAFAATVAHGENHENHGNSPSTSNQHAAEPPPAVFSAGAETAEPDGNLTASEAEQPTPGLDEPAQGLAPTAPGFLLREDGPRPGVLWLNLGSDRPPQWVCAPLWIRAKTRDLQGEHWGRWLHWLDAEHRLHQWAMPAELTCGDGSELARELARGGLEIDPSRRARELLSAYILHSPCQKLARCTERSGWHGDAFVLHDQVIGARSDETLLLQSDGTHHLGALCSGSLSEWQHQIAAVACGNSRLVFVLSLAFAAPLAELVNEAGGFHLVGGSSVGKSTALDLAASVWGNPATFGLNWRATTNGLEGLCAQRNDLLLILDELAQIDPEQAGEAAYLIANGQGKTRANRAGLVHPPRHWRVLLLSAGEIHLGQHLHAVGQRRRAGQEIRLLDLDADAGQGCGILDLRPNQGSPAERMQQLMSASQQHYGVVGRAFLQQLCAQRDTVTRQLQREREAFSREYLPADAAGQSARAANRFALVASAGELATQWGLTGWPSGTAQQAIGRMFKEWLQSRGGATDQEVRDGLTAVRAFIETHGESRFSPWQASSSRTSLRAGYRREQADGPYFYVLPQAFRTEVCQGFEWLKLARAMLKLGWLKTQNDQRITYKTRLPGMGDKTSNVYLITPAIWCDEP